MGIVLRAPVGRLAFWPMLGALVLAVLAGCAPLRHYESLLVLADAGAGHGPSRWKQVTEAPRREFVAFNVNGRAHTGDLYLPAHAEPAAGIVLVPGAVPEGKDDPRLVAFAMTLARARFAVLAPELSGVRELRVRPTDAREVADAFAWLASRPDLAPGGRAGIGAFSYAVGPAVLAALEPDIRERVRFIMAVGGYYDLFRAIRFFTTGHFEEDGKRGYVKPDDYGRLVFAYGAKAYLPAPRDHELIEAIAERKQRDRAAEVADLVAGLSREAKAVYEVAVNSDPARFPALLAGLPGAMLADLDALSLHNKDVGRLEARLLLVHGRNDNLIPYSESLALGRAAPAGKARVWLINRVLGHVDLSLGRVLTWQFVSEALPDIWRIFRAVDALLSERHNDPAAP
ncbi:MAG: alpha/beta hydrolase [Lautropia sp.]|nr:alpha/beta hydrolase [Lautropia sp.]